MLHRLHQVPDPLLLTASLQQSPDGEHREEHSNQATGAGRGKLYIAEGRQMGILMATAVGLHICDELWKNKNKNKK